MDNNNNVEELKDKEMLEDTISPENIVMDEEDDDSDMPRQETKTYKKYVKLTDKFMNLLTQSVGTLPYTASIANPQGKEIKVNALMKYIRINRGKISVDEMNEIISFISSMDYNHAWQIMEIIEDKAQQSALWSIFEDA